MLLKEELSDLPACAKTYTHPNTDLNAPNMEIPVYIYFKPHIQLYTEK